MCVVEMIGGSYLDVGDEGRREEDESVTVDLEGRDGGVQHVLEYHGVSLTACVQTFDVMQVKGGRKKGIPGVLLRRVFPERGKLIKVVADTLGSSSPLVSS